MDVTSLPNLPNVPERAATGAGSTAPTAYRVTFDGNGADGGEMAEQIAAVPTALRANAFTLAGSTFAGWNTAADGSGTDYADAAEYAFNAAARLFAQWEAE